MMPSFFADREMFPCVRSKTRSKTYALDGRDHVLVESIPVGIQQAIDLLGQIPPWPSLAPIAPGSLCETDDGKNSGKSTGPTVFRSACRSTFCNSRILPGQL